MSILRADYFDGKTSVKHPVSVLIAGDRLKVIGRDVNEAFDARRVRRSLRIANTPRWLYLPGGGACVTADNDAVDRMTRDRRYERILNRWESHPGYAVLSVVLVVAALWLLIDRAVPVTVRHVAEHIPLEAEAALGREALQGLEKYILKPTRVSARRQSTLREKLFGMAEAAGDDTPYRLEFRSSPVIGANAFALPSGIIVMTDELVKLAKSDAEVLAVLAHELGHVHHRHTMRRLLESSATALIIAGVTGDIASTTSLAAAAPTLLLQTKYSRENEREADAYSIEMMRKAGMNPRHFAAILERLESGAKRRGGLPTFLSSHPATQEREALALAGAAVPVADRDATDEKGAAPERAERKFSAMSPVQRQVIEALDRRDYEALERLLGGYVEKFERDPGSSLDLQFAFHAFFLLLGSDEVAMNEWGEKMPASYSARVARGIFHIGRGLEARGTEYIQDTPQEDIRTMQAFLAKARSDLEQSLGMTQKPYLSRYWLIVLFQKVGGRGNAKPQYAEAVKLAPQSLELRLEYMKGLEPRWGGSFAEMQAFAAESASQLVDRAAASRIAARIPAYRGWERMKAEDYDQALSFYNEAVRFHPGGATLCERSYVLSKLKRHAEAFADAKQGLSKARRNEYCQERAVWSVQHVDNWKETVNLMNLVLEMDPESAGAYNQRAWAYYEQGKRDLAHRDFLAAAKLGDGFAQLTIGKMYLSGNGVKQDLKQAEFWLRKAAAQAQPEAKRFLDEARRKLGKKRIGKATQ
ncbi:MAG: M48 family metalloprotease [Betaproteobacteria bacterium]|nr:M48 family metalloprotease [Betaproteobacteria bacterium]